MRVGVAFTAALFMACSVGPLDLSGKQCPCVDGYVCDPTSNTCVRELTDVFAETSADTSVTDARADTRGEAAVGGPDCSVHADKKLYCTHKNPSLVRSTPRNAGTIIDNLTGDYDWFTCWTTGDLHAGDNTTWYYTQGDLNDKWGYVSANELNTTMEFDKNATAYGLAKCP